MSHTPKIYVAGHLGMVGSAIVRQLLIQGHPAARIVTRSHAELDLIDQAAVRAFFAAEKPDQVYLAAAKVGGIHANNSYPAEFIYQNLMIEANIIDAAFRDGVRKLLFLAVVNGGGWLTVCRPASRADERWCGLLRVGVSRMHQTCRFKRPTSATKAGVNSAISVSMSRTWC